MASQQQRYLNTSGHPLDFDNGLVVGAGEWVELDDKGDLFRHYVDTGQLTAEQEPTKGAKQAAAQAKRSVQAAEGEGR